MAASSVASYVERKGGEAMALYAIDGTYSERQHKSNVYYFGCRYKCPYVGAARYFSGPGTESASLALGLSGAMFGTGSRRLVDLVVATIAKDRKYDLNVPIDLIGFSRGAAIANEVAWVLGTKGILRERSEDSVQYDVPSIRWMGLFDPVHSMGFPIPTLQGPLFMGNRRWCADRIPPNVKNSTVLVSKDERRELFRPSNLAAQNATRGRFHNRRPLDGDHSDVGGHIENNRVLARLALREMIQQAILADVPVGTWGLITNAERDAARERGLLAPSNGGGVGVRPFARPW
jgi:hypothetical protein